MPKSAQQRVSRLGLDMRKASATRTASSPQSAMRRAVVALRADSLGRSPGALIGQEPDLIARYGVSRPTLRQAARLVAQEQLVTVRRGITGGYYADRPESTAVAHMASIFLEIQGTKQDEIISAHLPIRVELVRLAAQSTDVAALNDLKEFAAIDEARRHGNYSARYFAKAERLFYDALGRASGSRVMYLFSQILLDLRHTVSAADDVLLQHEDRRRAWGAQRVKVIRAILDRNPDLAVEEAHRSARMLTTWQTQAKGRKKAKAKSKSKTK